jgi:trimeric autotransporter adhesin
MRKQMKTKRKTIHPAFVMCLFAWFALVPAVWAVSPPPDGGYPGFTTAEGQNTLKNLTTGAGNTAVGWYSLFANSTGNYNTAVGAGTLVLNNADSNTAVGTGALLLNTTGTQNTANGALALVHNTTGNQNTATGSEALSSNSEGLRNTANGFVALGGNTTGSDNTAVGSQALVVNTEGDRNTAVGGQALFFNSTGNDNTAVGDRALFNNDSFGANTAVGAQALFGNNERQRKHGQWVSSALQQQHWVGEHGDGGCKPSCLTIRAVLTQPLAIMRYIITRRGEDNTAIGYDALFDNTATGNTAVGENALGANTSGVDNTAIGKFAGSNATTGNNNVYIGAGIIGVSGENHVCYIASIFGQTSANGIPVLINSNSKLGTSTSSKRFKEEIKPMNKDSEALFALKPVSFRYKKEIDPAGISQFGLVAEEVEKVNAALVVRDKDGKPYSVRYDQVNAMLLNEFLKEHATVQELKKEIATLKAGLQKVSAQIEVRSAPKVVLNDDK